MKIVIEDKEKTLLIVYIFLTVFFSFHQALALNSQTHSDRTLFSPDSLPNISCKISKIEEAEQYLSNFSTCKQAAQATYQCVLDIESGRRAADWIPLTLKRCSKIIGKNKFHKFLINFEQSNQCKPCGKKAGTMCFLRRTLCRLEYIISYTF